MTAVDEAQALPQVSVVYDPPMKVGNPHQFAQALLERICAAPARACKGPAYKRLVRKYAVLARLDNIDPSRLTTEAEDHLRAGAFDAFATELVTLIQQDLARKVGLDLATTLVPLITSTKE